VSSALKARINRFLRRLLVAGFVGVAGITLVAYASEITISSYDAVQQKNGKTVFLFNPPEPQTCVHTLFPHAGFVSCWYLQRHTEPRTNI
jgi:hypothetical protein